MRLRHPDGTTVHLGYCTNVHPAEDLRRDHRPSSTATRRRYGELLGADRLGVGLWLAARGRRALAADPRRGGPAARRTGRARPGGGHPQRLPLPRASTPRWSSTRSTNRTGLDPRAAGLHPRPGRRAGRAAARRRGRAARSRPCRWPGATPGRRRRPAAAPATARWTAGGSPRGRSATGRPVRVGFEPEPGCVVETADAGRATDWPAWTPATSGVCLDLPIWPAPGRNPPPRWPGWRRPACPWSRCRCPRRCRPSDPDEPAARDGAAPRTSSRASCTRPAVGRRARAADDLGEALDARPGRDPGGCTSTCRCTPPRSRRCTPPRRAARRARRAASAAERRLRPPRGGDVHLERAAARPAPGQARRSWPRASRPNWRFTRDELAGPGPARQPAEAR